MPIQRRQADVNLLTTARELDRMGRSLERYLSMQLQQLEASIARFDRERAAWQRRRQAEIEQLDQSKRALAIAWDELKRESELTAGKRQEPRGLSSILSRRRSGSSAPLPERHPSVSNNLSSTLPTGLPFSEDAAGTGSAPLKLLLDPGSAGEEWLAGLMIEISKLNRELGGTGVRFELHACRRSAVRRASPSETPELLDGLLLDLELFSRQPLVADVPAGNDGGLSADLVNWERFKSTMLLTPLVDRTLSREFDKGRDVPATASDWHQVTALLRRVDDADLRLFAAPPPTAWTGTRPRKQESTEERVRRQVTRVETVASVLSDECSARVHVSLV